MTFLTPLGGLVALAALLPLAAALAGRARVRAVRRALRLPPPSRSANVRLLAAAGSIAVLGLAAAQPALSSESSTRVRTGVAALFVVDTSRSMAASATASSPTRLDRAVSAAVRLRAAIPSVASGVATMTDRVLPDLLPVADVAGFDLVAERAVAIESPPPRSSGVRATSYAALEDIASGNYFEPRDTRRIVVLLTDGESNPFDPGEVARALPASAGYRFLAVRFWSGDESVYDANGKAEAGYRPDPTGRAILSGLAAAMGGRSFEEREVGAAAAYLRQAAGTGPTALSRGVTRSRRPLAPFAAVLAALLALVALAPRRGEIRGVESMS